MKKNAFSLIELSIVILIIGILIAGVTQSSRLIRANKLNTAKTLTQSSPVASIKDLVTWLEASSDKSFIDSEAFDGGPVSAWYDINPQSTIKRNYSAAGGVRPFYTDSCINALPCIKFDGVDDYLNITTSESSVAKQSSIFLVIKFDTISTGNNSLLMTNGSAVSSGTALFQVSGVGKFLGSTVIDRNPVDNWGVTNTSYATTSPYIISIVDNAATLTTYVNGVNDMASTLNIVTSGTSRIYDMRIGGWHDGTSMVASRYLAGGIGELIIFDRGLKNEERKAVEKYLGQKWGLKVS